MTEVMIGLLRVFADQLRRRMHLNSQAERDLALSAIDQTLREFEEGLRHEQ